MILTLTTKITNYGHVIFGHLYGKGIKNILQIKIPTNLLYT